MYRQAGARMTWQKAVKSSRMMHLNQRDKISMPWTARWTKIQSYYNTPPPQKYNSRQDLNIRLWLVGIEIMIKSTDILI